MSRNALANSMRVVIDTSCLIASVPRSGEHYWLYQAFIARKFEWIVSQEIITEYEEKLSELYAPSLAKNIMKILAVAPHVFHVKARTFMACYVRRRLVLSLNF